MDIMIVVIKKIFEIIYGPNKRPFEKALHLICISESGIHDLGQHHRKYLLEKVKTKRQGKCR